MFFNGFIKLIEFRVVFSGIVVNGVAVCSLEVEGWTESYLGEWNSLQQEYPDTAPINVGNMGAMAIKPHLLWSGDVIEVKSMYW